MGAPARNKYVMTCPASGKRAYTDKARAKNAAKETGSGLSTFKCEDCGYWHVGHRSHFTRQQHRERHQG